MAENKTITSVIKIILAKLALECRIEENQICGEDAWSLCPKNSSMLDWRHNPELFQGTRYFDPSDK
jgi:hypothetical protein